MEEDDLELLGLFVRVKSGDYKEFVGKIVKTWQDDANKMEVHVWLENLVTKEVIKELYVNCTTNWI